MVVAALVLPDRLDKTSLMLARQPEKEVRESTRLFHSSKRTTMFASLVLHWI